MKRVRNEGGFSLFEMLIAIMMLGIGIIAAISTISAGVVWARQAKQNMTLGQVVQSVAVYCMEEDIKNGGAKTGSEIPEDECSGYFLYLDSADIVPGTGGNTGELRRLTFKAYQNKLHLNNRNKYDPIDTMSIVVYYR